MADVVMQMPEPGVQRQPMEEEELRRQPIEEKEEKRLDLQSNHRSRILIYPRLVVSISRRPPPLRDKEMLIPGSGTTQHRP